MVLLNKILTHCDPILVNRRFTLEEFNGIAGVKLLTPALKGRSQFSFHEVETSIQLASVCIVHVEACNWLDKKPFQNIARNSPLVIREFFELCRFIKR